MGNEGAGDGVDFVKLLRATQWVALTIEALADRFIMTAWREHHETDLHSAPRDRNHYRLDFL